MCEDFTNAPSSNMGKVPVIENSSSTPNSLPGSIVLDSTKPTLSDLENTLTRVEFEKRTLENSRSPSENVKSRIAILDKVKADISEYISQIKRQKININDVPFTKSDLGAFLLNKTDTLSTKNPSDQTTLTEANPKIPNNLSGEMGDLKWKVKIEYDPTTSFLIKLNKKMDLLFQEMKNANLSPSELDTKKLEMKILEQQLATYNKRRITDSKDSVAPYIKDKIEKPEIATKEKTKKPFFMNQKIPNYDNQQRVSQDYSKRASNASFDNESIKGVDYRKKADFLCNQIKNADLGDPADFGCIKNPETDVSPDYSWRGNYKMVCNRLGRIWGGWYPEMFGCPPVVGTEEQAPVIFESNK